MKGVVAAAITPRGDREQSIDLGAIWELLDFLGGYAIDGIALLGAAGEFVDFEVEERKRIAKLSIKRSSRPVLIDVSHSNLDAAIGLGQAAARAGAAGLLLMPPYFYRYSQESIHAFFLRFGDSLRGQAPVYLCNAPLFTNALSLETSRALLRTGLFAGIQDSSGDCEGFEDLRREIPFTLLVGGERNFAAARRRGAGGVVSGAACVVPELVIALDRALQGGNEERVLRLDGRLNEFLERMQPFPSHVALKEAARARGLKTGAPANPLGPHEAALLRGFSEWFPGWLLEVQRECKY